MRGQTVQVGVLSLAALLAFGVAGCNSVPVTGRRSLNLVDDKELTKITGEAWAELKKTNRLSQDPKMNEAVQRVCSQLVDRLPFWEVPLADWEFVVFDAPKTVNALAMPGGKVAVFSGIFSVATTDDQLAVVIAHEIAHVTAKHVHERLSQQMVANAGGTGLGLMTGGLTGFAVRQAYNIGTNKVGLGFDRAKETEADHIGLIYMARAGYDPRAAVELWEKMDQAAMGKDMPEEWQSTHPSSENRLARLYGWMEEAEAEYQKARKRDS
jgi:metalloendopeptidase OMA1, mitochondrial